MQQAHTFNRTLGVFTVTLFGLAYMSPMAVFTTYGVATDASKGMLPAAYVLALAAMLFTAFSYGRMVKAYPISGSAYTYTQKTISPHAGLLVGWAILMDYLFLPLLCNLIFVIYISAIIPSVPKWVWIVGFVAVMTLINYLGIKVAARINTLMIAFQVLAIVLFFIFAVKGVISGMGEGTLFSTLPFNSPGGSIDTAIAGAAILALSFLGFDAVTTFTEEAVNPTKTIPKAILLVAFIGGGTFIIISYVGHLVFPDYTKFTDLDSAALDIAKFIGGTFLSSMIAAGMIVTGIAAGIASHASVARLLYAMGRDSVLPKKVFGYIHPKYNTPSNNVIIVGFLSLASLFVGLTLIASFINFGALIAFTFVNISVITHYYVKNKHRSFKDTIVYLIMPLIGAGFTVWLWINLDRHSMMLGGIWMAAGFIYLVYVTKMFTKRPPEMRVGDFEKINEEPEETKMSS
ncbi:APC family permease [Siminovitchia acidinfaciens]|uniref:APC family permease n=1 Tax=Siminovitchia acidinfaciens TaxID=2321395 RepID=A0A429Y5B0_9BACI|nr:APC family permease [Siminovitchia acidinfaciens]RST76499.1 APC family permease [Siminovitchia acidinfaciens]